MFFDFNNNDYKDKIEEEYNRLKGGGIPKNIKVGDKVIIAAGIIGRGFVWVRKQCEVIEVCDTSCLVKHKGKYDSDNWEEWIDKFLIVDICKYNK